MYYPQLLSAFPVTGLTVEEVNWPLFVFRVIQGIGLVPVGLLLDYTGARKPIVFALTLAAMLSFGLPMSQNIYQIVGLMCVYSGTVLFGGLPSFLKIASSWFSDSFGVASSIIISGFSLAGFITPLMLGTLATRYGWRTALLTIDCIFFLVGLPLALLLVRPNTRPELVHSYKTPASSRTGDRHASGVGYSVDAHSKEPGGSTETDTNTNMETDRDRRVVHNRMEEETIDAQTFAHAQSNKRALYGFSLRGWRSVENCNVGDVGGLEIREQSPLAATDRHGHTTGGRGSVHKKPMEPGDTGIAGNLNVDVEEGGLDRNGRVRRGNTSDTGLMGNVGEDLNSLKARENWRCTVQEYPHDLYTEEESEPRHRPPTQADSSPTFLQSPTHRHTHTRPHTAHSQTIWQRLRGLLQLPFVYLILGMASQSVAVHVVFDHITMYTHEDLHMDLEVAARYIAVVSLFAVFAKLGSGLLTKQYCHYTLMVAFACVFTSGFALMFSVTATGNSAEPNGTHPDTSQVQVWHVSLTGESWRLYLCSVMFGVGYAGVFAITTAVLPSMGAHTLGLRSSVMMAVKFTMGAFGSSMAATLRERTGSYMSSFALGLGASSVCLLMSVLSYVENRRRRRTHREYVLVGSEADSDLDRYR
ncbi:hypothetical protein SARC_11836 [Sphaeroforma arctica JP610]|uniref:Major facilitator superfamily (MFS) profile domain-containing protein n=1 Tax=Sphaeroforma arctica JP610 TaxID=667725 RepID=A0A0L0FFU8_9EUKA|nr:hypothetical protein SARC_11836 [Sphaeroforma arctica JP610]KNC75644.1 hypothetical protein SARC_11836 [Sphaeroforma arctica JP610]|eukprot:XP_014149546.1 hypothetical protein SARC_11836 [Sphaeroforma arctica JP610]